MKRTLLLLAAACTAVATGTPTPLPSVPPTPPPTEAPSRPTPQPTPSPSVTPPPSPTPTSFPSPMPTTTDGVRFTIGFTLECQAKPRKALRELLLQEIASAIDLPLSALQGLQTSSVGVPTHAPTPLPTLLPTPAPSPTPSPAPSPAPTPSPSARPSPKPSPTPSVRPSPAPTYAPTPPPTVLCGACDQTLTLFLQTNYYGSQASWSFDEARGTSSDGTYATNCSRNISTSSVKQGKTFRGTLFATPPDHDEEDKKRQYNMTVSKRICANQKYEFVMHSTGNGFKDPAGEGHLRGGFL